MQDYVTEQKKKAELAIQTLGEPAAGKGISKELYELVVTNPFMFVDIMAFALKPSEFKKYFIEINGMSTDEMVMHLRAYVAEVLPKLKLSKNDRQRGRFGSFLPTSFMAGETGLEPATPGFGDRCSTN